MSCLSSCLMSCLLAYILPCILKCFVMSNLIHAFLICVPNFSSLAWLEVPQEPPSHPQCHTLRTLKVPDWRLQGWHHESSWYVIFDLCTKFQLSSMNRSASRTPCPSSPTWRMLKVPDRRLGGWGHTWRVGSSRELILNVSWRSDSIWLRYWYVFSGNRTWERQTDRPYSNVI